MPQSCGAEPAARRAAATSGWAPTWSAGVRRGARGRGREGVPGPHVVAEPGAVPTSAWPQRRRAPRTHGQPGGSQDPLSARPRKDTPGLRRVALGPRPAWRPCVVPSCRVASGVLSPAGNPAEVQGNLPCYISASSVTRWVSTGAGAAATLETSALTAAPCSSWLRPCHVKETGGPGAGPQGRAGAGGALASLGGLQAHGVAAVAQTVTRHSGQQRGTKQSRHLLERTGLRKAAGDRGWSGQSHVPCLQTPEGT